MPYNVGNNKDYEHQGDSDKVPENMVNQDTVNNNKPILGPTGKPPAHLKFLKSSKMKKSQSLQEPLSKNTSQAPVNDGTDSHGAAASKGNVAKIVEQYGGSPTKTTDHYNYRIQQQVVWNKDTQAADKYRVVKNRPEMDMPPHAEKTEKDRTDAKADINSKVASGAIADMQDAKHYHGRNASKYYGNESAMQSKELIRQRAVDIQNVGDRRKDGAEDSAQDKVSIVIPPSRYLKSTADKLSSVSTTELEQESASNDAKYQQYDTTASKSSFVTKHDDVEAKSPGTMSDARYTQSGFPTFHDYRTSESDRSRDQHASSMQDSRLNPYSDAVKSRPTVDSRSTLDSHVEQRTPAADNDLPAILGSNSRHRLMLESGKHPLSHTSETPRFGPVLEDHVSLYQTGGSGGGSPRELTYVVQGNRTGTDVDRQDNEKGGKSNGETPLPTDRRNIIKVWHLKLKIGDCM